MARPTLPPVPDVIPFEDECAREVLRDWAEAFAVACERATAQKYLAHTQVANEAASRSRYPDTKES